ncbi:MAG: hypothetical protein A3K61_01150 [Thaumarchaeota archaeon RBG_16_49_8]|nr:MAG: hypothetical protein A3K61_01150 [Thaumarchaeota archaeon RBG_16_49_8]
MAKLLSIFPITAIAGDSGSIISKLIHAKLSARICLDVILHHLQQPIRKGFLVEPYSESSFL